MSHEPDPDLLAAALRGAESAKRAMNAVERVCAERGIRLKPGDASYIAEAVYEAFRLHPERKDQ